MSELTPEQLAEWEEWCDTRPPVVAEVARRFPPWKLLKLKTTGQRGMVRSYYEDGTVQVEFFGWPWNISPVGRLVFGIDPGSLEETDEVRPWPQLPEDWWPKVDEEQDEA